MSLRFKTKGSGMVNWKGRFDLDDTSLGTVLASLRKDHADELTALGSLRLTERASGVTFEEKDEKSMGRSLRDLHFGHSAVIVVSSADLNQSPETKSESTEKGDPFAKRKLGRDVGGKVHTMLSQVAAMTDPFLYLSLPGAKPLE